MMKKLSLKSNAFDKGEVLTRAQLKKVMGGDGSGWTSNPGLCRVMYYDNNHVYQETDVLGTSSDANAKCMTLITNGATRCWFDCSGDGWGS